MHAASGFAEVGTRARACGAAIGAAACLSGLVVGGKPTRALTPSSQTSEIAPSATHDAGSDVHVEASATTAERPVEGHPLRCGERILRVGSEWREVLESDLRLEEGSACMGIESSWLPTVDATMRIVALDGERITKLAVRYPKDDGEIGGRTFLVDESQITEEGQPADGGVEPRVARNADRIRSDAALVNRSEVAWPLPPVLPRSTVPVTLPFNTVMRALRLDGTGVLDSGQFTLRSRGIATRAFGRTRAFDALIETHQGTAGLCHSFDAKLVLHGTMWFAEHEDVLVEAQLEANPVWTDTLCTTCGRFTPGAGVLDSRPQTAAACARRARTEP